MPMTTVAGIPRNFERAGASGAHLLTHLLDQDEAGLAGRIALYRNARAAAGFDPSTGMVSLMIHTLVGADAETVREQARAPYCNYIKANMGLFKGLEQSRGRDVDLSSMSEADLDEFVNFLYERFAASRGLIGTPESCAPLVERLEAIGVDELACLLDFGPHVDLILENLPHLNRLKEQHESTAVATGLRPSALKDFDRQEVLARCTDELTGDQFLGALGARGIAIDGAYRPAATIWRRDGEAMARLSLTVTGDTYGIHPASLDACGRTLAAALPGFGAAGDVFQLGNPAFDEPLLFARSMVFGVFRKIAMFTSFGDGFDHCRSLNGFQSPQFHFEDMQALWRHRNTFHAFSAGTPALLKKPPSLHQSRSPDGDHRTDVI